MVVTSPHNCPLAGIIIPSSFSIGAAVVVVVEDVGGLDQPSNNGLLSGGSHLAGIPFAIPISYY